MSIIIDLFQKRLFDDEMINLICEETNLYSAQCNVNKGAIGTCKDEIEKYLGILIMMSLIKAPYYRFYRKTYTRYEPITSQMSRDSFETIKRFLHFNDNLKDKKRDDETRDRLFKIRSVFEKFRQNCLALDPEEHNSIDEQIIPFKERSFLRRYMPKKPQKWSFRIFSRNSASGMLYYFELEGATDTNRVEVVD